MAKRYELTSEHYAQVKKLLPGSVGDRGRSGTYWHDLPERYDKWMKARQSFSRWGDPLTDWPLAPAVTSHEAGAYTR
jgi:hypothetical protein